MSEINPFTERIGVKRRDMMIMACVSTILFLSLYFIFGINQNNESLEDDTVEANVSNEEDIAAFEEKFGFDTRDFYIEESVFNPNQFIGDILYKNGISYALIAELERKAKDVFDVKKIKSGKNYAIIKEDSCDTTVAFAYEPDPLSYVLYDFRDSISVQVVEREFTTCIETASGKIESSLWNAIVGNGHDWALVDLMENSLSSSVDFYFTQKGDEFKLIYEKNYIDGEPVSLGNMLGAYYKNVRGEHYSIYFESDKYEGFFDHEGRPSKKSFLKAPVKYSRISSRFNRRRFHPIKKTTIPHLGTDYAARTGTPIQSVADGVVLEARYTKNNGFYIKIRHDKTYTTQYLHMSRFQKGIAPGATVNRGQVIGYVGSTGLATGPHVCFRFWKNGKQIDHMRENFPPPDPISEEYLEKFFEKRNDIVDYLRHIPMIHSQTRVVSVNLEEEEEIEYDFTL